MIGNSIYRYDEVESTNAVAKELAMKGEKEGAVVIARAQSAGKGRSEHPWFSPNGGVWLSILLRPNLSLKDAPKATLITLISSVAVAKTLKELYAIDAKIKWPNDVLVKGKKACGVINVMATKGNTIEYVITGIGINTNFSVRVLPKDVRFKAISIKDLLKKDVSNDELVKKLLIEFDAFYADFKEMKIKKILEEWRSLSDTLGRSVQIVTEEEAVEGIAEDIDDDGALVVKTGEGARRKIFVGECIYLQ